MQNKKKNTAKNILLTGSIIAGSVFGLGALNANATETFKYHELGSGGELRSELLNNTSSDIIALELDCGEDTKNAKDSKDKNTDAKSKDQKCGEGKAAVKTDKAADPKVAGVETEATKETKDSKTSETKSKEAKCGEGKCGD